MTTGPVSCLLVLGLLVQSALPIPLRTGTAAQLTARDISTIQKIVPGQPWLLYGSPSHVPAREFIAAYVLPTRATPLIRRGTAVSLSRLTDPRSGKVGEWTADDRPYEYAQVAIAGRRFEEIRDEYDLNRPFRVIGRFEDEEIIELVNFVRSKANEERDGITIRAWPILSLDHDPRGSVRVMLWEKPHGGQTLLLRLEGKDNWVITAVGVWAA